MRKTALIITAIVAVSALVGCAQSHIDSKRWPNVRLDATTAKGSSREVALVLQYVADRNAGRDERACSLMEHPSRIVGRVWNCGKHGAVPAPDARVFQTDEIALIQAQPAPFRILTIAPVESVGHPVDIGDESGIESGQVWIRYLDGTGNAYEALFSVAPGGGIEEVKIEPLSPSGAEALKDEWIAYVRPWLDIQEARDRRSAARLSAIAASCHRPGWASDGGGAFCFRLNSGSGHAKGTFPRPSIYTVWVRPPLKALPRFSAGQIANVDTAGKACAASGKTLWISANGVFGCGSPR